VSRKRRGKNESQRRRDAEAQRRERCEEISKKSKMLRAKSEEEE